MEIGKNIRLLRTGKGMTQEKLAQTLGVSPQAVSRWENGSAMPDINLLPALSVCFGVRIDDFFELSDDAQYDRINDMAEAEFLPREDFDYAQRFLKDRIAADPGNARPLRSLAHLYIHRAMGYRRKAEKLVKRALELEPEVKESHSILSYAAEGACFDWCGSNHRELIEYYYGFVERNPNYISGYLWLLDNLIADYRLTEAETVLARLEKLEDSYRIPLYRGHMASLRGDTQAAERHWKSMTERWSDEWVVWSCLGDARARQCRYEDALECYHKAAELEKAPHFVDNWDSIGQICELLRRWDEAAEAYENVLEIHRCDYGETEGSEVERYEAAALRCRLEAGKCPAKD